MNDKKHHPTKKLTNENDSDDLEKKPDNKDIYPDYPIYPPDEDIYSNCTEEVEIDPEQTFRLKEPVILSKLINQLDFTKDLSADELDVPGAELDDNQEILGSEDEENNYYSLGGDDHDDLDEAND
jgi:hypothetical protein